MTMNNVLMVKLLLLISISSFANNLIIISNENEVLFNKELDSLKIQPPQETQVLENDYALSKHFTQTRAPVDCEYAEIVAPMEPTVVFTGTYGPLHQLEVLPWVAVIKSAMNDASVLSHRLKDKNTRKRPFLLYENDILKCENLKPSKSSSFPSGHATVSRVVALLLSEIFPGEEIKAKLLNTSDEISLSRIISGVHFMSDVKAGKQLGDLIFSSMMKNPKFTQCLKSKNEEEIKTNCEEFTSKVPKNITF